LKCNFGDVQAASTAERLGVLQAAYLDGEVDFLTATHFAQIASSLFVTPQTCNASRPRPPTLFRILIVGRCGSMGKKQARKPAGVASSRGGTVPWWTSYALGAALVAAAAALLQSALMPATPPARPMASSGKATERASTPSKPTEACFEGADDYMCPAWHKAGGCRDPTTRSKCARTCGACPGVAPRNPPVARADRCQRDNLTAAVPARRLTPLFERILADYPQYAISRHAVHRVCHPPHPA